MPFVQTAYLALVICCFLAFALVLAWGAWWSRDSRRDARSAAQSSARKSPSGPDVGAGLTA